MSQRRPRDLICVALALVLGLLGLAGCGSPSAEQVLKEVTPTLEGREGVSLFGLTPDEKGVFVELRADAEPLAKSLKDKYGDRIQIRLGQFAYPLGARLDLPPEACPPLPAGSPPPAGLEVTAVATPKTVAAGANGQGAVQLRNTSATTFSAEGEQPLRAVILRPGTGIVAGTFTGAVGGTGTVLTIPSGGTTTTPLYFGTASCDATVGYRVPAGDYDLVAVVEMEVGGKPLTVLTPPTTVTVTGS